MKVKILFSLLFLMLFCVGCKDSKEESALLEVSQLTFNDVSNAGETLEVDVTTNGPWTASSNAKSWCTVTPQMATESRKLTINIEGNLDRKERTATVTVLSQGLHKEIKITQEAAPANPDEYLYQIPVIFHVLYNDASNDNQNVREGRLPEMLNEVNQLYRRASVISADMNVEFVLATTAPDGNALSEPGVERIEWPTAAIDIEDFMFSNDRKYNYLIWEPNDYINVMVYNFTNQDILGVSHFPYSPQSNPLEGTEEVSYHLTGANLRYAYCLSINSTYIYQTSTPGQLNQNDAAITLAHELGHYLGLRHTFSEDAQGNTDVCLDSDYCADTPTYNRKEYEDWLGNLPPGTSHTELFRRYDCRNGRFTARNIMDYSYCYMDEFTQNQKARVRHVLTYSPLIPGPKKGATTRAVREGLMDLPIVVME